MQIRRRDFLAAGCASLLPLPAMAGPSRRLVARPALAQLAPPEYPKTGVWGFDGLVPGRELRLRQGEQLDVSFENALPQNSSIHWHGLRIENAMDGVPGMTQDPVPPGGTFAYRFVAPDAGTFWYHPHVNSVEQVSRGLAGVLIVDEREAPDVDQDITLVFDDWRMNEDASIAEPFDNRHDRSHAGRIGNHVTINGTSIPEYEVRSGERLRLRLVNTATARVFELLYRGLEGAVVAYDGMPLAEPVREERLVLAPGQRMDVIFDVTAEAGDAAVIGFVERGDAYVAVDFPVADGAAVAARGEIPALPRNREAPLKLDGARPVPLAMAGGAMRGMDPAVWNGERMELRELAAQGQFWAFNGVVGLSDEPFLTASLGETVRIPITNDTAFPHAMHLHGHHFRDVRPDGSLGPWRDTILVAPDETREIAFVADNPGEWAFHCHMLSHSSAGMMSRIKVG